MTILASGPESKIQQCDWFLSGLQLADPTVNSGDFRTENKKKVNYGTRCLIPSELRFRDIHRVGMWLEIS